MQSYINGSTWFFQEVEINPFGSFPKSILIYLWPMAHEIGKLCCHYVAVLTIILAVQTLV